MQNRAENLSKLFELIKNIRFGMLTHVHTDQSLHAHPMTTLQRDSEGQQEPNLYFFLPKDGEIYRAMGNNANFNMAYVDSGKDIYISVTGRASDVPDQAIKEELFSVMTRAWFPNGPTDPNLGLIRLSVDEAEIWDVKESKISQVFKMLKATITGEPPRDLGEHTEIR